MLEYISVFVDFLKEFVDGFNPAEAAEAVKTIFANFDFQVIKDTLTQLGELLSKLFA